ncbi:MAG: hypothetical protein KKF01_02270, partial [Proteobacteria bacterium]|nr:hypothetical protein [Pseudomonadota bacterium]
SPSWGGITGTNIDHVLAQGVRRVAVVTAVTMADDMAGTIAFLREKIRRAIIVDLQDRFP